MKRAAFVLPLASLVVACGGSFSSTETPSAPIPASASEAPAIVPATTAASAESTPAPKRAEKEAPKTIVARHVLVQWMGCRAADSKIVRTREQARQVIDEAMGKLKAGVAFTRVVADYSDEPNSAARGGSLGRFGRGVMDPAFENAAFALAPGERSGIVETQFGFHIIERLE